MVCGGETGLTRPFECHSSSGLKLPGCSSLMVEYMKNQSSRVINWNRVKQARPRLPNLSGSTSPYNPRPMMANISVVQSRTSAIMWLSWDLVWYSCDYHVTRSGVDTQYQWNKHNNTAKCWNRLQNCWNNDLKILQKPENTIMHRLANIQKQF